MNIVTALKESVQAATGLVLHYGSENELNIKLDYAAYPCAYGVAIDGSTIDMAGGSMKDQPTIVVAFVSLSTSEAVEDLEVLIEERKKDCFKWLASLRRSTDIQLVSVNQAGRLYWDKDAIICGYSVNLTIRELIGYIPCPQPEPEPTPEQPEEPEGGENENNGV